MRPDMGNKRAEAGEAGMRGKVRNLHPGPVPLPPEGPGTGDCAGAGVGGWETGPPTTAPLATVVFSISRLVSAPV